MKKGLLIVFILLISAFADSYVSEFTLNKSEVKKGDAFCQKMSTEEIKSFAKKYCTYDSNAMKPYSKVILKWNCEKGNDKGPLFVTYASSEESCKNANKEAFTKMSSETKIQQNEVVETKKENTQTNNSTKVTEADIKANSTCLSALSSGSDGELTYYGCKESKDFYLDIAHKYGMQRGWHKLKPDYGMSGIYSPELRRNGKKIGNVSEGSLFTLFYKRNKELWERKVNQSNSKQWNYLAAAVTTNPELCLKKYPNTTFNFGKLTNGDALCIKQHAQIEFKLEKKFNITNEINLFVKEFFEGIDKTQEYDNWNNYCTIENKPYVGRMITCTEKYSDVSISFIGIDNVNKWALNIVKNK